MLLPISLLRMLRFLPSGTESSSFCYIPSALPPTHSSAYSCTPAPLLLFLLLPPTFLPVPLLFSFLLRHTLRPAPLRLSFLRPPTLPATSPPVLFPALPPARPSSLRSPCYLPSSRPYDPSVSNIRAVSTVRAIGNVIIVLILASYHR